VGREARPLCEQTRRLSKPKRLHCSQSQQVSFTSTSTTEQRKRKPRSTADPLVSGQRPHTDAQHDGDYTEELSPVQQGRWDRLARATRQPLRNIECPCEHVPPLWLLFSAGPFGHHSPEANSDVLSTPEAGNAVARPAPECAVPDDDAVDTPERLDDDGRRPLGLRYGGRYVGMHFDPRCGHSELRRTAWDPLPHRRAKPYRRSPLLSANDCMPLSREVRQHYFGRHEKKRRLKS